MYHRRLIKTQICELGSVVAIGTKTFQTLKEYYKKNPHSYQAAAQRDQFRDKEGRIVTYRGINIAAKIPLTDKAHLNMNAKVSFVNTPFSLEDAPTHFTRLKYLGFNLIRWVVPWEAICPESPGSYDKDYLTYLDKAIELAEDFGFFILIDFHQDVWSRFTGGSGAPLWTLEKLGLQVNHFEETLASIVHNKKGMFPLGHLFWATNADRYAVKTMYTLFFGGNTFAPDMKIEGKNVQDFLQDNYIEAIATCASKLKRHTHIIGYDIMNEPHLGFIGSKDLNKYHGLFRLGPSPLPLQSFSLAEGIAQEIDIFEKKWFSLKSTHKIKFDPKGKGVWQDGSCIWRKVGVWGYGKEGKPALLRKNYFSTCRANEDFYLPFISKACKALSNIDDKKINFIEHATGHPIPKVAGFPFKIGFSGHWYDAFVISMRKVWSFIAVDMLTQKVRVSLPHLVQQHLSMQIFRLLRKVQKSIGAVPFLLSEFGIPFDLHGKKAYRSGNFSKQKEGLERSFRAIEKTMVSSIIWNYTSVNSNEKGDLWNNEDFSIFSPDQIHCKEDPYSGIRGKEAIVRPYPVKTPGTLSSFSFNSKEGKFTASFTHNTDATAPLEIFLPDIHFGKGFELQTSAGRYEVDYQDQRLYFYPDSTYSIFHRINIYKKNTAKKNDKKWKPFF